MKEMDIHSHDKSTGIPPGLFTVGEVARRAGVKVSTLHFYEARGLISSVRSKGNQRRYSRDILRRIAIIRVARNLGISLEDIAALIKPIPAGTTPSTAEIQEMVANWRAMLQRRIDGLSELRDQLDGCIGCGCLSMKDCPLRNPRDTLAATGSGPMLLRHGNPGRE